MEQMLEALLQGLPGLGLELPEDCCRRLCTFGEAVVRQNAVMNLTAITNPVQVARLHLLDSLTVLTALDLRGKSVIDVGCGAGFPGVPLKIACPELRLTLLDSLGKRITWLREIALPELGIQAECVTARAEEAVSTCRESYDVAVSRAVARLQVLLELTAPYVQVGGRVVAMKGAAAAEELEAAKNAISQLGLRLERTVDFPLEGTAHTLILLRKERPTPPRYPRKFSKIKQSPL